MSMTSEFPMDKETIDRMEELFGKPVAHADNQALFDKLDIKQKQLSEFSKSIGQQVEAEQNQIGDVKFLGDVKYILTEDGWEKQSLIKE